MMQRLIWVLLLMLVLGVGVTNAQTSTPQILRFETSLTHINRAELNDGTALIPLSWEVSNRRPIMNLEFEQILPDGTIQNVELPRANQWVNSNDVGVVVPLDPGMATYEIHLQVRLYSLLWGETLDSATLIIPIVDVITPNDPPSNIQINHFTVTPTDAVGGDPLTVSWDVSGLDAILLAMVYTGSAGTRQATPQYANIGTVTLTAPEGVQTAEIMLIAGDLRETLTISLTCRIAWFSENDFENGCPDTELQPISATYQAFENGYMLMRHNSDKIWIYANYTASFHVRPVNMTRDAQPFSGATPEGLYRPTDNLGVIWENSQWVREQLGWAIASEQTYTMRYQESPFATGTGLHRYRLFTLPDGTVIAASLGEM